MSKNAFYLTTTLPYVNAEPHIGFALEIVAADVIARSQRLAGSEVVFNTGTDEHGQKIFQQAAAAHMEPQAYTDLYAAKFADLRELLNLSYSHFIRTTNPDHKKAAQHFWQLCEKNGDIYKNRYKTLYCIGCELEKQNSELVDGKCPLHPTKELEVREEENYFFRFSKYQQPLLDFYTAHPTFVRPASKMKEITAFVQGGLQDFSISRLKEKMPWGVPVPGDDQHVMYVWFDALINYISTLGWPENDQQYRQFWPGIQLAGKDNLRQQAAMWQAMLLSAGQPNSSHILINGFISVDGQKMSKSLGNVISPVEMVARYGVDGTRYLLMFIGPFGSDMDVSWEQFDTFYTAHLANGIGNVCSRIAKLGEKLSLRFDEQQFADRWSAQTLESVTAQYSQFQLKEAVAAINEYVTNVDEMLSKEQPWLQTGDTQRATLTTALNSIVALGKMLEPLMPDTSKTILTSIAGDRVTALKPLFPRLSP